jgi:hypothetical protein
MAIVDTAQARIFVGTHFFAIVPLEVRSRNAIYDVLATLFAPEEVLKRYPKVTES